jgi:hypothetical protein
MQKFALIRDGVVAEVIKVPASTPPLEDRYHPDVVAACVELIGEGSTKVEGGWLYDGTSFSEPSAPEPPAAAPEMTKDQIMAEIHRLMTLVQALPT